MIRPFCVVTTHIDRSCNRATCHHKYYAYYPFSLILVLRHNESRRRSFGGQVNFNCSQAVLGRVMGWYCEYTTKFRLLYHTINYSQTLSSLHLSIYDAKSCQTPILVFAAQISLRIFVCVGTPSPLPIPSKHPHSLPARLV